MSFLLKRKLDIATITHQEKVDLPDDCVLQVVPALVVLKLNVQAVLNTHLHLQGTHISSHTANACLARIRHQQAMRLKRNLEAMEDTA